MIGIYMIRNLINGKIYIGQSTDIEKRWKCHKKCLNGNYHINKHLQSAWNKYGEENFEFIVLCECEENQLNTLEQYYIFELFSYNPKVGYNKNYGGNVAKPTEETKRKMSESQKGEKNHMYGKYGEENHFFGKHHTEETRKKMSEAKRGEKSPSYKGFICIYPNNEVSKVMTKDEMVKFLNIGQVTIWKLTKSKEPYKFSNKARGNREHLKTLEGIRILYYEDYLKELEQAS